MCRRQAANPTLARPPAEAPPSEHPRRRCRCPGHGAPPATGDCAGVCLTGLAGFVDAMGLRTLGDLFVSFMSGDSTEFAARVARGDWPQAGKPATLIGAFVLGAALGSLVGRIA